MIDRGLRQVKEDALAPLAARLAPVIGPDALTLLALASTLAAAALAWARLPAAALAGWLLGRVLDGLDGAVARARDEASDAGGYLDILADTVGYAALPIGVALGVDSHATWIALAALLGSFYVNAVSWTYLAAVLEKRGAGAASTGELTTVTMPVGLIEGTETIVLFGLFVISVAVARLLQRREVSR